MAITGLVTLQLKELVLLISNNFDFFNLHKNSLRCLLKTCYGTLGYGCVGGWVKSKLKLTQSSWAGAGTELGKNPPMSVAAATESGIGWKKKIIYKFHCSNFPGIQCPWQIKHVYLSPVRDSVSNQQVCVLVMFVPTLLLKTRRPPYKTLANIMTNS